MSDRTSDGISNGGGAKPSGAARMPAEWEPHEATWLAWPWDPDTWPGVFERIAPVWGAMVRALREGEIVRILSRGPSMDDAIRAVLDGDLGGTELVRCPTTDVWVRDYGPTFVLAEAGSCQMVDWTFNAWGGKYSWMEADDAVPEELAEILGMPRVRPDVVLEGGSIDVDGEGTLLTTEACLLHPNRNAGKGKTELEVVFREFLGVEQTIWLGEGILGDDTDGHVDDLTRFVAPGRVVTAVEEDPADENYLALRVNRERLEGARDAHGRRLEIADLPMPRPVVHVLPDGERLLCPASYANFYVGNASVLVPTFRGDRDATALGILADCFPGRRVVGIDSFDLVLGLGSVHCVTQQQPENPFRAPAGSL